MKSLFDKVLIKEQLKRYWAIGVLHFLVYLLLLMPIWKSSNPAYAVVEILSLRFPLILILNIIVPLAAASTMFSHIYKPNAAIAVYTMPFSRKKIFCSNALAGFFLIAVPLLIFSLLLLVYRIDNNFNWYSSGMGLKEVPFGSTINTIPNVTMFFLRTLLSFSFYYVLFIMAAMIVGNQIMHLIVSALLAFFAVIVKCGFDVGAAFYIFGYYVDVSQYSQILIYTNPLLLSAVDGYVSDSIQASYYAVYVMIMIILIILSALMHHMRRLECTADMVVFTPIKHFLVFITSVSGMIFMGGFFHMIFNGGMVVIYVGFVVGFVLAFYKAQMIIEKSFNVLYRMKGIVIHGLALLAIISLFNAINVFNIGGYVKYVPKADEVSGVYLAYAGDLGRYRGSRTTVEAMFIKEPYIIEKTIQSHEMIIENRRNLRKLLKENLTGQTSTKRQTQYITYMLKNGAIVTREYLLSQDIYERSGMQELVNGKSSLLSNIFWVENQNILESIRITLYKAAKQETDEQTTAEYYAYNIATSPVFVYGVDHVKALAEAVKEDYLLNEELIKRSDPDKLDFLQLELSLSGVNGYDHVNLYYYENTLKCLLENGYSFKSRDGGTEVFIGKLNDN